MNLEKNLLEMADEIRQKNGKRVLIQLPEGLKTNTAKIVEFMKNRGIDAVMHNNPSYGACDLADLSAKQMGCDLLVHVGHNKFYKEWDVHVPVLYFPWIIDVALEKMDFSAIKEKRIGLVTNIQHLHILPDIEKLLKNHGKEPYIGGQILGCWTANAVKIENQVDAFLFVGSGIFHSLALKTDKPVYGMDLERNKIELLDMTKMEKIRWARIYKARDSRSFGILVTTKGGQNQLIGNAEKIMRILEEKNKKAVVLVMDEITSGKLMGIDVDAFINTACPRITDDAWDKPIINATDIEKLFADVNK